MNLNVSMVLDILVAYTDAMDVAGLSAFRLRLKRGMKGISTVGGVGQISADAMHIRLASARAASMALASC